MNQTTNLIQWKNLTDDEKAGFDWSYKYKFQFNRSWNNYQPSNPCDNDVYRLKIEPDKWYYLVHGDGSTEIIIGKDLLNDDYINRLAETASVFGIFHSAVGRGTDWAHGAVLEDHYGVLVGFVYQIKPGVFVLQNNHGMLLYGVLGLQV